MLRRSAKPLSLAFGWHHRRMADLEGKVAFISGGSGGLSSAFAAALAAQGAAVAVADLPTRKPQVESLVNHLQTQTRCEAWASS
jgi:NAD(P)-dependent dehydrogenase (short-subunit alcohol dehydrogenase family)